MRLTAAALAMVATALAHVLALTTPRPRAFFSWIVGLVTVVGVVLPFASDGSRAGKLATALVVIGLCVRACCRRCWPGRQASPTDAAGLDAGPRSNR